MAITRDYGDRALLIECGSAAAVVALDATLRASRPPGVLDIVPGARTVLVTAADPRTLPAIRTWVSELPTVPTPPAAPEDVVVIEVMYDGPDLTEVADLLWMGTDEVIAAHTGTPWRVGFCGFTPGFGYLVDGDPRLRVPRRAEPRIRVPAGSVALAGEFSGIYPRESPGGWQLIGRTEAVLWDLDRPRPALLTPGTWVRFRSVGVR